MITTLLLLSAPQDPATVRAQLATFITSYTDCVGNRAAAIGGRNTEDSAGVIAAARAQCADQWEWVRSTYQGNTNETAQDRAWLAGVRGDANDAAADQLLHVRAYFRAHPPRK